MKVVGKDGSEFVLGKGGKSLFGRSSGYNTDDRIVSRQHVSFEVTKSLGNGKSGIRTEPRVLFEVIGRNPIWVWSKKNGATSIFRKFEKGELEAGDRFCLSGKSPLWFSLKQREVQEEEKRVLETENEAAESSQSELDFDDMDVSAIDPVKEFGFIKTGHEFDHYPTSMIRNVKNWEWFLEEPSDDEEEFEKERRDMRRKRKRGKSKEDDEWTGESDDDKDIVAKTRKAKNSRGSRNYTTRSKDSRGQKDTKHSQNSRRKKATGVEETLKDEDEDDETLGGFIVDDEDEELGEENKDDEEEEFEDDGDEM
ncbi:hypothetical protein L6164_004227 [Bauhinia variegata]|uniref:Uncharacterized protein n=1 Tax=Bauhinia variegata TaxID=167791 RepID=A0ACB9Q368_BAUVA|nr:hypothetical protein L6164_004227 [Bauhinia variegata]